MTPVRWSAAVMVAIVWAVLAAHPPDPWAGAGLAERDLAPAMVAFRQACGPLGERVQPLGDPRWRDAVAQALRSHPEPAEVTAFCRGAASLDDAALVEALAVQFGVARP